MRFLGIDMGGCAGNNTALVVLEDGKITRSMRIAKQSYKKCNKTLAYLIKDIDPDFIGMDAPLSIPKKLYDPTFKSFLEELDEGEITNPYLYRECEYFIYKHFGIRPMPPVGDRIGRITARAIDLLRMLAGAYPIYELYPKQIAQVHKKREFNDRHLQDAYLAAFGAMKIAKGDTLYPIKGSFKEGWVYPIL